MLRKYSEGLHVRMTEAGAQAPSADVIEYALKIIINTVFIATMTLVLGLITGEPGATMVVIVSFAILRLATGGYHLTSNVGCIVGSTIVLTLIPHIHFSDSWTLGFTLFALVMVAIFAPSNFDKYAWIKKRHYPILKVIGMALVASNLWIQSDLFALTFAVQTLLLPFKEGGEEE
ncbi:accessory gene regulator B family protein [Cohnella sp. JJ-181]|uniref:accessory gene regulator B family protein n=1 Tax=Cohnella rhizoplanae TaxID=2974897 RepID=UPI0022FF50BE|nr:accessory gene regulator B family protein [Cohnella sp. JJ-181]CAI6080883.1 Accessory gene regulator protein B [Cohnella sp. JJ-181]